VQSLRQLVNGGEPLKVCGQSAKAPGKICRKRQNFPILALARSMRVGVRAVIVRIFEINDISPYSASPEVMA
jgi:hypothetical protein